MKQQEAPNAPTPIDWNDLFERIPDEALILQFAASYKDTTPQLFQRLQDSIARQDPRLIEANAHAIKGSAANLGAIPLAKTAWQLEIAAREQGQSDFAGLFSKVETEYRRLMDLLSHPDWIERLKKLQPK